MADHPLTIIVSSVTSLTAAALAFSGAWVIALRQERERGRNAMRVRAEEMDRAVWDEASELRDELRNQVDTLKRQLDAQHADLLALRRRVAELEDEKAQQQTTIADLTARVRRCEEHRGEATPA